MTNSSFVQSQGRYFGQQLLTTLQVRNKTPVTKEESSCLQKVIDQASEFYCSVVELNSYLPLLSFAKRMQHGSNIKKEQKSQQSNEDGESPTRDKSVDLDEDGDVLESLTRCKFSINNFFNWHDKHDKAPDNLDLYRYTTVVAKARKKLTSLITPWPRSKVDNGLEILLYPNPKTTPDKLIQIQRDTIDAVKSFMASSHNQLLKSYLSAPIIL